MWYYDYIVPSFLVLLIFQFYYLARPRLPIRTNRSFQEIIIVDCLVILFDVLASEVDMHYPDYQAGILYGLNMAFFVLFLLRIYCFFLFTVHALQLERSAHSFMEYLPDAVFVLSELLAVSSIWNGSIFRIDADGYHKGPAYNVLYVCFLLCIAGSVLLASKYKSRLRGRLQYVSILLYNGFLLAGNIFRILFPQYLLMNLFCLFAIIIIFIAFQNPDLYLSDRGVGFNQRGFKVHLSEMAQKKEYYVLGIAVQNYIGMRGMFGGSQVDRGIDLITRYLKETFPDYAVYYLRSGCFALAGDSPMDPGSMKETISSRFVKAWKTEGTNLFLDVGFVYMEAIPELNDDDAILTYFYMALGEAGSGKGNKVIGQEYIHEVQHVIRVKKALERALKEDTVEVFLQPIVDSGTKKVICAEALARIRDDEGQIVFPDEFIFMAENIGEISAIGRQVLNKVCRFIREYHPQDYGIEWINVNLSPLQCMNLGLASNIVSILEDYQVGTERIHLELTEEAMSDSPEFSHQVNNLMEHGFQFSLDDYGKGYSNLNRIKQFAFSNIKLDMSIVWDYFEKRDILLPSMVQTFKAMGFQITAEGIESEDMAEVMSRIGCDYLQGFVYSRPVPIDQFAQKYMYGG